ncbi:MAG: shikimate kinase [Bacteroidota bacterium]
MNEYRLERYKGSIYMCGFMGAGKSTIGKQVAEHLDLPFKDLDKEIEESEQKTIPELFSEEGEGYFREKEWEVLLHLTRTYQGVLALGGGALHNQKVVDHLKLHGLLVFIDAPLKRIVHRVLRNPHRPIARKTDGSLKTKQDLLAELKSLYSTREMFYQQAQIHISTKPFKKSSEVIPIVIEKIKRHV